MNSLDRSIVSIEDSKKIAIETSIQLKEQTDQMGKIYDDLHETDDILSSSQRYIDKIVKRISSDKCIWGVGFILVGAIIAAITLSLNK